MAFFLCLSTFISLGQHTDKETSCMFQIQEKADSTIASCFKEKNDKNLLPLIERLRLEYKKQPVDLNLYWQGYLQYFQSIIKQTNGDKKGAKECINNAYKTLDKANQKNSESYALMALVRSYSINFNRFSVIFISRDAIGFAKKAIKMEPNNPRGYYARGSHEFYTPSSMRKNKDAEKWLLKVIELSQNRQANPFTPSWGEQEAYELLIRLYQQTGEELKAKKTLHNALKKYPNNYQFKKLEGA
ncbi:hypothetical protein K5X82_11380 [Halosquirtibacter xylanolyticus]|uniref:tetratricopeptide repeat protein n=1 Tax=Halosquirtibacter xylanolyticus TaxID=3374599 RepID=UPI00374A6958|nr:hypothetical protein K5X82_11380 [Prolixibacteraceae bacterium]